MSKGSKYRPVNYEKWSENYDRIFKQKISDTVPAAPKGMFRVISGADLVGDFLLVEVAIAHAERAHATVVDDTGKMMKDFTNAE